MSHVMTQKEKIEFLYKAEETANSATGPWKHGHDHFVSGGDYKDNPYQCTPESFAEDGHAAYREWAEGFEHARYATSVGKQLTTVEPITFRQVLDLPRELVSDGEIMSLIYHNMLDIPNGHDAWLPDEKFERIDVEQIFFDYGDGNRTRTIGVISFDSIDTMVFNHAGRGGYEYHNEFVLNREVYNNMLLYIQSVFLENSQEEGVEDPVYGLDDDAEHLINFYGKRLEINEEE